MTRARPWLELGLLAALAAAVVVAVPESRHAPTLGLVASVGVGAVTGVGIALALAGGPPLSRLRPAALAGRRLGVGGVLVLAAAGEETVFRRGIVDALAAPAGVPGAVAAGAACFALVHGPAPRRLAVHAVTGSAFGAVYALTGRLAAAVAAHAAYNLVVLAGDDEAPPGPSALRAHPSLRRRT